MQLTAAIPTINRYTVVVTKNDGVRSEYLVVATSAGGAEETCLREVYAARYALASLGWNRTRQTWPDLISRGAAIVAVDLALNATK